MAMGKVVFGVSLALAIVVAPALAGSDELQSSPVMDKGKSGWAVVNKAGYLVRGMNATGVDHVAPGRYIVRFNSDVSSCAYVATLSGASSMGKKPPPPGAVEVHRRDKTRDAVRVSTFGKGPPPGDSGFDLIVQC